MVIEGDILSRICGIQFEGGLPVYWNSDFFTVGGLVHLRKSEYKVLRNILKKSERMLQYFMSFQKSKQYSSKGKVIGMALSDQYLCRYEAYTSGFVLWGHSLLL